VSERPPRSVGAITNASALTKPSDMRVPASERPAPSAPTAKSEPLDRHVPPPMRIAFAPGDSVQLAEDQRYADKVLVRRGERGKVMHPSSQAASWVVWFPMMGPKHRVVPERLLRPTD
jgi:hypothetical protein